MDHRINDQKSENLESEIKSAINQPDRLEQLYRSRQGAFKKAFHHVYSDIRDSAAAAFWNERLKDEEEWGIGLPLGYAFTATVIAWVLAKIPDFTGIDAELFYIRNAALILAPLMAAYFVKQQKGRIKNLVYALIPMLAAAFYINLLPANLQSDTFKLACMHLPFVLWSLTGYVFTGSVRGNLPKRIAYLRFSAGLIVIAGLLAIAGFAMFGITYGLFELIGINLEYIYQHYLSVLGLAALPFFGTFLIQSRPSLVKHIGPAIANIFTPLVTLMLFLYLLAMATTGKDPYNDREFLLLFNVMLVGVLAIIVFSAAGFSGDNGDRNRLYFFKTYNLTLLATLSILVNSIALSAILFRIMEWGITPNRIAVAGANILFLFNLIWVWLKLIGVLRKKKTMQDVETAVASYLSIYTIWSVFVVFILSVLFAFR